MKGKVKSFSRFKGYGFIVSEEIDHDIFFHYSDIQQAGFKLLKEGEVVEFDYDEKSKQAIHIIKSDEQRGGVHENE